MSELWWVGSLTEEIHRLVEELYRSNEMVATHERLQAQNKLAPELGASLAGEKIRKDRLARELRTRLADAVRGGVGYFRGVQYDGSALGATLADVVSALMGQAVPELYPKLKLGARPLRGDEAEKILTATNLAELPPVFYEGENGLGLVINQGGRFLPNPSAEVAREVLDWIRREHAYGTKVTGKTLEAHFAGIGYAWDRDLLRLILAVLLRAGAIEVTHQGRKYRTHADPVAREPFLSNPAFRAASFAPREALSLKLLTDAVRHFEDLTGREVEIEEGAIASALQRLAAEDRDQARPLLAGMRALALPGQAWLEEYLATLDGVLAAPSDDCVRTLAGEGQSLKESRQRLAKLATALAADGQTTIRRARVALEAQWPVLAGREPDATTAQKARELGEALRSEEFYDRLEAIRLATEAIRQAYAALYEARHHARSEVLTRALDEIRGLPDWAVLASDPAVTEAERTSLLAPLATRACKSLELDESGVACQACRASVAEMEADVLAAQGLSAEVLRRLQARAAPRQRIERVRLSAFLGPSVVAHDQVEADLDEALQRLREHILKLLAEGAKVIIE